MRSIEKVKIATNTTIKDALRVINDGGIQIALVVDENDRLLGTITDGDIRRGILEGLGLDSTVESIIFTHPTIAKMSDTKEEILRVAISKKLHQIPILDELGRVLGIQDVPELIKPKVKQNEVVLMVGGLGTRLRPLTENTPKPMLKVGGKPIIQTIVESFLSYGYTNFTMCVNYKSEIIREHFGDGSHFGARIRYVLESKRMGTAGALSLILAPPTEPFFVMNGDLLTNINFEHLHDLHMINNAYATMCVREYEHTIPYGVVDVNSGKILGIKEKPTQSFFVSAGIYMLSPDVLSFIPKDEFYDMPTLFEKLIKEQKIVSSFPVNDYWLDIGRMEEYKRANEEYDEVF
ncbi:nucleotidyltransferase family protein [Campylobacter suis]|uniref:UTP--glucose-1-phosphate uridylyltransferase n=1 Tax=Campylobacter suis TaxID=2790657 RepID=A0ABM8Q7F5_9BACT|nr:nucleotidyltransferase family protein [Campylobacter suis]CAD7288721.1 UTP--glucose-1-phosphate uridylyltransferase [Campylobacter suis]